MSFRMLGSYVSSRASRIDIDWRTTQAIRTRLVCGTDGQLVDSRLIFVAHYFIDNPSQSSTGRYHRPAKHDHEAYSFILQDGDYMLI
ncbi:hypothetical protein ARMGADRAFT_1084185 [Armillaria gallica]|uniref:Uncharacterized protein n=1 Tax=Armillaria gallica TaxID=47427 RepID=A0A2H3D5Q8_ARMGA|nr:hypothetical protein ARMGADRAFT_1084185 [Armillaria gallica]